MDFIASLSNAFSGVADSDFVIRTVNNTHRLIFGTGYGSNINACMYINDNCLGIQRFPEGGHALDVLGQLKVDNESNVKVTNNLNAKYINASNIFVDGNGIINATYTSSSNITATNINSQSNNDLIIGNLSSNIYINSSNIYIGSGKGEIGIGDSNTNIDTINISGLITNINTTDLKIKDKLITLNNGGGINSGGDCGFEINENNVITGYIKTSTDRSKLLLRAPTGREMFIDFTNNGFSFNNVLTIDSDDNVNVGTIGTLGASHNLNIKGDVNHTSGVLKSINIAAQNINSLVSSSSNATVSFVLTASNITCSNATINSITASNIVFPDINAHTNRKIVFAQPALGLQEHQMTGIGWSNDLIKFQGQSTSTGFVYSVGATQLTSTELMRLTGTGNLGIGTSTPVNKLDVKGNIGASNTVYTTNVVSNFGPDLRLDSSDVQGTIWLGCTNSNGAIKMLGRHVLNSTTLSIGVAFPTSTYSLDVGGTGNFQQIRSANNNGILNISGLKNTTASLGESTLIGEHITYNASTENFTVASTGPNASFSAIIPTISGIRFFTGFFAGQSSGYPLSAASLLTYEQLTITTSSIGMGTASPQEKLHINSSGNTKIRLSSPSTFVQGLDIYDSALRWSIFKPANSTDLLLQGDGNLKVTTSAGVVRWTAPVSASDRSLKTNIRQIDNVLDKLENINAYSFDFLPETKLSNRTQLGVIAQEIEPVFPELVIEDEDSGLLSVAYDKLSTVLLAAVKELNTIVKTQASDIIELKDEIAKLKAVNSLM
jgi:hypothetical protein